MWRGVSKILSNIYIEAVTRRCSVKKVFLQILASGLQLYQKRDSGAGDFFCKFYEIFKNTFF